MLALPALAFEVAAANLGLDKENRNLLPAEQAFPFAARAIDARTIEVRFAVAPGYYLYRDKLRFSATPAPGVGKPLFPAGEVKDDRFFGRVEVFRGDVLVRLPVVATAPGSAVVLSAEAQGCADAGVCYPPIVQRVMLELPQPGAGPLPFVDAQPARKRLFN